ncbi:MAG: 50S ribosomal protein L11 methyltransferase [Rikenellaceae bacterium]|nr:50S ribosomal protein L11 methyltransferase [Rikenellaceae bacterium]MDE7355185.1 50S ribosomal protein L11 methyltransferase [Rikenellaceae bacterium]
MRYKRLKITLAQPSEEQQEIIIASLADMGFDSFDSENESILSAYIPSSEYDVHASDITLFCNTLDASTEIEEMEDVNWNAVWESNFSPIEVNDRCVVRAPFHSVPKVEYDLVIMPKMSFGTGHHATTCLMLKHLLERDIEGLRVLDMGCGTGVLAILAAKRGACHVDAIDIDEWAAENARENITENNVAERVEVMLGDASLLKGRCYDLIVANINRNILLADMSAYADTLSNGGTLIISGFLGIDCDILTQKASSLGLREECRTCRDDWHSIVLRK